MTTTPTTGRPVFYKPAFGNDNFYGVDVVDIAAFTPPVTQQDAAVTPAKKLSENI